MKNNIIQSLSLYFFLMLIIGSFYMSGTLWKYNNIIILGFVSLFIKDIFTYLYISSENKKYIPLISVLIEDVKTEKVSIKYMYLFFNRLFIFPTLLVLYLFTLVVKQVALFSEHINLWDWNTFLWIIILSGILTIFSESKDQKYMKEISTTKWVSFNVIITMLCALWWSYIISLQTAKLWFLHYPISIICGVLIFLIWLSIIEEESTKNNSLNN